MLAMLTIVLPATGDPISYTLTLDSTGDAQIDQLIDDVSRLAELRDTGPVPAMALISRAEADAGRLDAVLRSLGYYDALIEIRIAARPLDDPQLLPLLQAHPSDDPVSVEVVPDPGPLYRLGRVRLDGPVPDQVRAAFDLRPGAPARAADVVAAGEAVLNALLEEGFALARVPRPDALVDHDTRTMDVRYLAEPGPRLAIGTVTVTGLERLREDYVLRRLGLEPGEPFSPSRLEAARRDLMQGGVLAWARLTPAAEPDADGRLPLSLELAERPRRVVRLAGAYSSDEGLTISTSWTHRNLFGRAERLDLRGDAGQLTTDRSDPLSYLGQATLTIPDWWRRDLDLSLKLGAVSERLDAYDRDAKTAGLALARRVSDRLSIGAGVGYERSRVTQLGEARDYRLLSLPLSLALDAADDLLEPSRGLRGAAWLSPTHQLNGDGSGFLVTRVSGSGYLDLSPLVDVAVSGSTVLAARLVVGRIIGAAVDDVPPDWRFYAGGGGSVRGYPFQSIGPSTPSGTPTGGNGLLEGSLELRQRLTANWAMAGFVDAGAVSEDSIPEVAELAVGVGLGVRYSTPAGPVRVDVAVPLDRRDGDASAQLYIGIGQSF